MKKLNTAEIQAGLQQIDSKWEIKENCIHREIVFKNFVEAFSFMTSVAMLAEKDNHHPNWKNTYNKVTIALNTHDADGITHKDFDLAKEIDTILSNIVL
ncbi:4a-hydroxytetrahydrobiopterin dehydratase [Flavobacterium eburneipallidum]|uniref:4a-hydroxytetrahydrobiopterin dehydratase n=1 Tax=Flavobacterium eburneipallidum TaxID=3003263 RepID=UPI0022AC76F4|nr:4a-hydroxytetrahydrobiopterin dehydratase [Flavobacterium eburneipallidum]